MFLQIAGLRLNEVTAEFSKPFIYKVPFYAANVLADPSISI